MRIVSTLQNSVQYSIRTIEDLKSDMQNYGLLIDNIITNKLCRCPTYDKPREKSGFYYCHVSGNFINAGYGDYRQGGELVKWSNKKRLTISERAQVRVNFKAYQEQAALTKTKTIAEVAAHYNSLSSMRSVHSYLCDKGIPEVIYFTQVLGLKVSNRCDKAKIYQNNTLLIPFYLNGSLSGYQQIYLDNAGKYQKRYTGSIGGCMLTYTTATEPRFIMLAEGFVTGWSAYLALNNSADSIAWGAIVVIGFDSGNLKKIIGSLIQFQLPILLFVDYDTKSATGQTTAKTLINNNPELQIIPILLYAPNNPEMSIDANDYIIQFGENAFYTYVQLQLFQYGLQGLFA